MQRIRLHGEEYVLIAGGAIAKQDDYENGRCSFAHLCDDDVIRRFHEEIGHREDIEIIGECEPEVGLHTFIGMFCDPSWSRPGRITNRDHGSEVLPTDLAENPWDKVMNDQEASE